MRPSSPIVLHAVVLGEQRVAGDLGATVQLAAIDDMLVCLAYLHESNFSRQKYKKIGFANQQSIKQLHSYSISLFLARDNYAFISVSKRILKIPTHAGHQPSKTMGGKSPFSHPFPFISIFSLSLQLPFALKKRLADILGEIDSSI